jgi:hypothetical protein
MNMKNNRESGLSIVDKNECMPVNTRELCDGSMVFDVVLLDISIDTPQMSNRTPPTKSTKNRYFFVL